MLILLLDSLNVGDSLLVVDDFLLLLSLHAHTIRYMLKHIVSSVCSVLFGIIPIVHTVNQPIDGS